MSERRDFESGHPGLCRAGSWCLLLAFWCATPVAAESVDLEAIARIQEEGFEKSQVMELLVTLTDEFGPRLTGSPGLRAASHWSRDQLSRWGLENARLEPWGEFGQGWSLKRLYVAMSEPWYLALIAFPEAWTQGTSGLVSGSTTILEVEQPEDLPPYQGKLKGRIVLWGAPENLEPNWDPEAHRRSPESLQELVETASVPRDPRRLQEIRRRRELESRVYRFLSEEGALALLRSSPGSHGTLFVGSGGSFRPEDEPTLPSLVVSAEHYALLYRLTAKTRPVRVELWVEAQFHREDPKAYNVIAEIPGQDPRVRDEVVMLGAHLDSWHAATGATDNAAGCAVMMEAVRILQAAQLKPRRTVRIALWSGEEQGLLGSKAYVERHFGPSWEQRLPAHEKVSAYFNLDNGTGQIRGVFLQGNQAVRPIFAAYLEPFHDLGAQTLSLRGTGGTDHLSFDRVGIPGFQFIQDPIAYRTRTHHTNMDLSDHALAEDLKQASVIVASFVYHTAMREERLPRKPPPRRDRD